MDSETDTHNTSGPSPIRQLLNEFGITEKVAPPPHAIAWAMNFSGAGIRHGPKTKEVTYLNPGPLAAIFSDIPEDTPSVCAEKFQKIINFDKWQLAFAPNAKVLLDEKVCAAVASATDDRELRAALAVHLKPESVNVWAEKVEKGAEYAKRKSSPKSSEPPVKVASKYSKPSAKTAPKTSAAPVTPAMSDAERTQLVNEVLVALLVNVKLPLKKLVGDRPTADDFIKFVTDHREAIDG